MEETIYFEEVQKKMIIKKKIYNRLKKDCEFYKNQINDLQNTISKMAKEYPDDYEINKKKEMLEESEQTLKYVNKQKEKAMEDMYSFIEQHLEDGALTSDILADIE